uniref:Uncharacterized protein n=1 Tax=Anguilla anguilla TaxID=7936 RepID=A0A0E9XIC5_ANGAN
MLSNVVYFIYIWALHFS